MCGPAAIGVLKFLAPIVLPSVVSSIMGKKTNVAQGGPSTHARGIASKAIKQVQGGEDYEADEGDGINKTQRTEQALQSARRQTLGTKVLDKKAAPGTDLVASGLGGGDTSQAQQGINLGSNRTSLSPSY